MSKKQDVNVTTGASYELLAVAESIQDAGQHISEGIHKGVQELAKSNYDISSKILTSSQNILSGLSQIANEIERSNKQNEYYTLTSEIATYEDTLIEMGVFKEAFSGLQLTPLPIVTMAKNEIEMLIEYNSDEMINIIQNLSLQKMCSPKEVIKSLIMEHGVVWQYGKGLLLGGNIRLELSDLLFVDENKKKVRVIEWTFDNDSLKLRIGTSFYTAINNFGYPIFVPFDDHIDLNRFKCSRNITDEEEKTIIERTRVLVPNITETDAELLYNVGKTCYKKKTKFDHNLSKVLHFNTFIESLNRDITLSNLRMLHSSLRASVRDYKIKNAI